MTFRHLLPALLLALATATAVQSYHVLCSWKPGPLPPSAYGFNDRWCMGNLIKTENNTKAQYKCDDHYLADWNYLAPRKLEMAKPCAKGGFAYSVITGCDGVAFARCLGDAGPSSQNVTCLYTSAEDDCEWPDLMDMNQLPPTIDVWVKKKHWRRDEW